MNESSKELAYLFDLYVTPDWSERFAVLFDEHVKPPKQSRVLYVGASTGGYALSLKKRAGTETQVVSVDENSERVELARAKALVLKLNNDIEFHTAQIESLPFEDESFQVVIGEASLLAAERLPEFIAEMARVAKDGATVALSTTTSSSFGEVFSIYWEALAEAGEQASNVETLITELPIVSDVQALFANEGLSNVQTWTSREEFDFETGEEFLRAPLIENFLLPHWLEALPDAETRAQINQKIARIINDERNGANFTFSIKATLVTGHKSERD